jgi:predicted DsbA family dithiol-disulfide isomerase
VSAAQPSQPGAQVSIQIDFVSDVVCPWCAVGLRSLEIALERLGPAVHTTLVFRPFQLNPDMGPQGEDIGEYLQHKYGSTPQQQAQMRETIRQRGEAVGFEFAMDKRQRTYNTFDAHRLLHWAHLEGKQHALKSALLRAYFTDGDNPSDAQVLLRLAQSVGLDPERAQAILAGDDYADAVRAEQDFYRRSGIQSVPAIILNERHLISGGQPPEVFERALRGLVGEMGGG